jgi:hypothetical protein
MTNTQDDLPSTAVPGRSPKRAASSPQTGPLDRVDRPESRSDLDPAEALLHALIAECHAIIRDDVMPSSRTTHDSDERRRYYNSVTHLVGIATGAVDAITRLRGGTTNGQMRQRITVERIASNPPLLNGRT